MAVFDYVAIGHDGRRQSGVITSDSARSARKELRLRQLSPLEVQEAREKRKPTLFSARGKKMPHSDLVLFTRQVAMLIQSGAPVEEALGAIASEADHATTRRVLMGVRASVTEGNSFAESLSEAPTAFPPYYRAVIAAGQGSGRLGDVMERLADHLEKSQKMRRKIVSALVYPAVLTGVAMLVVSLLMVFVVPAVVKQFDTLGQDLPWLTRAVIGISDFLRVWGIALVIALVAGVWGLRRLLKRDHIRQRVDSTLLALPVIGRLVRAVNSASFARTFSTLSSSGATVPDALNAARGATSNAVFAKAIGTVRRSVEEGQGLARSLRETAIFPPMLIHMVASGERGGDLAGMMGRAADYLEDEFDGSTTVALGLLEPLLIVVLAGVVALIVLSIMLPILQLNTLAIG